MSNINLLLGRHCECGIEPPGFISHIVISSDRCTEYQYGGDRCALALYTRYLECK